jgi:hypothetical protein
MRILSTFFVCVLVFQIDVFAELSSSSCDLLRTATSLTTIIPEIAQLAMRYYRASSSVSIEHHRQKRFLFNDNTSKNVSSNMKGTVVEQMIANAVRDINFTSVAILIMNNNETMNKIRQNVDNQAIIRSIMREINYEKLGSGLLYAAETEFDLEHFIASILNITRMEIIHEELFTNGTLPGWLLKKIQRTFSTLKNVTYKFVRIMSKSNRFDNYLFDTIIQQAMTPLSNVIQGVKDEKPKTFDQLIEIIVNNVNKVMTVSEILFLKENFTIAHYIRSN